VRDEEGLELRRRHLEALVLDDLLEPVDDEDLVVIVHEADVSGVQPAFLVDGVLRRLWVVQVTCRIPSRAVLVSSEKPLPSSQCSRLLVTSKYVLVKKKI
jgi:hypothetical protein